MPPATHNSHWTIAAVATAIAGAGLVLLQPLWWEGVLFMLFQGSLILWLRPAPTTAQTADRTDALSEEVCRLHIQLEQQKDLLKRVLPLWGEQIQQAQDQLNMPRAQTMSNATRSHINLILDAARADMHRLCELNCYEHNNRNQPDSWLSTFAGACADAEIPQKHARMVESAATKNASLRSTCAPTF